MTELVVKPKKTQSAALYFMFFVVVAWTCISAVSIAIFYFDETFLTLFSIVLTLLCWSMFIGGIKTFGRTLIFSSEGCTVKFCGISRFYAWSEIVAKRLDTVEYRQQETFRKGICFSTNSKDCDLTNGYSDHNWFPRLKGLCVYLVFEENVKLTVPLHRRNFYLIDENTLMTALREWGVDYDLA